MHPYLRALPWAIGFWAFSPWGYHVIQTRKRLDWLSMVYKFFMKKWQTQKVWAYFDKNEVFKRCVKNAPDSFHADGLQQDVCLALRMNFSWHLTSLSLACRQSIRLVGVNTPSMSNFCISLTYSCLCVSGIALQFHFLHFTRQKQVLTSDIGRLLTHNSV